MTSVIGNAAFGEITLYYLLVRKECANDFDATKARAQSIGVGGF